MNTMELFWTSLKKHFWNVISPQQLWVIFLIAFVWTMFSNIVVWYGKKACSPPISDIQFMLFLIFAQMIFIATVHKIYSSDTSEQKKEFSLELMTVACGVLAFMSMIFIWIMFSEYMLLLVSSWLGTKCDRAETLSSIGYGMGGVLAVIGAIAINRRAEAQTKSIKVQADSNELIAKRHIYERAQYAIGSLGNELPRPRIFAFYQLFYLAVESQDEDNDFNQSILDMLCAYLRDMTADKSYKGKKYPTRECQILLNLLFRSENKHVFSKLNANLQGCHFVGAEFIQAESHPSTTFEDANLKRANFKIANMADVNFKRANLSNTNLWHAILSNADLSKANLSNADLWHVSLLNANLSEANLSNANLSNANLSNADLLGVNLLGTNFQEAQLEGVNISGARFSGANFMAANLIGANLPGADFSSAGFLDANLSTANLSGANLSGANFSGMNLSNTNLLGTNLSGANLSGTNLSNMNLSGANLSNANLQQTQLKDANLMDILNIKHADFRGAKIGDRPITKDDLPADKGEYYADWNPPPEKEES